MRFLDKQVNHSILQLLTTLFTFLQTIDFIMQITSIALALFGTLYA